jgi:hypothetical protein
MILILPSGMPSLEGGRPGSEAVVVDCVTQPATLWPSTASLIFEPLGKPFSQLTGDAEQALLAKV